MSTLGRNILVAAAVASATGVAVPSAHAAGTAATRTVLTVTSATTPTPAGQQVFLRAAVKPVTAGTAPTGTVTFLDGTRVLGTAALVADPAGTRVARISRSFLPGRHSLTAKYQGSPTYAGSQSLPVDRQVTKAASRIVLSQSKGAKAGTYNVVAAVKPTVSGSGLVPSGTVTFTVDSFAPQAFALNDQGRAHLTISLRPGSHTARVSYSGNSTFLGSTAKLTFTLA